MEKNKEKKKNTAGRHTKLTVKRPPPYTSDSNHLQIARERAGALTSPSSCLDGGVTRVGPGQYPQYTRADFGPEAVGSSIRIRHTSPNVKPFGRVKSCMVAEPMSGGHDRRMRPSSCSCYATI